MSADELGIFYYEFTQSVNLVTDNAQDKFGLLCIVCIIASYVKMPRQGFWGLDSRVWVMVLEKTGWGDWRLRTVMGLRPLPLSPVLCPPF